MFSTFFPNNRPILSSETHQKEFGKLKELFINLDASSARLIMALSGYEYIESEEHLAKDIFLMDLTKKSRNSNYYKRKAILLKDLTDDNVQSKLVAFLNDADGGTGLNSLKYYFIRKLLQLAEVSDNLYPKKDQDAQAMVKDVITFISNQDISSKKDPVSSIQQNSNKNELEDYCNDIKTEMETLNKNKLRLILALAKIHYVDCQHNLRDLFSLSISESNRSSNFKQRANIILGDKQNPLDNENAKEKLAEFLEQGQGEKNLDSLKYAFVGIILTLADVPKELHPKDDKTAEKAVNLVIDILCSDMGIKLNRGWEYTLASTGQRSVQ